MTLDMTADQIQLVKEILEKHLPANVRVYVFGSRIRGNAKKFSDLDLAIDFDGAPVSMAILSALSFDFEESDLPYKVDLIDLNTINSHFKKTIEPDLTLLSR